MVHVPFDVKRKANYFKETVADQPEVGDAVFAGLVYNAANASLVLSDDSIRELRELTKAHKEYKAERLRAAIEGG